MKAGTRKGSKQVGTPAAALRRIDRGFYRWLKHNQDVQKKATEAGRRLLTEPQLQEIERAVDQCRQTAIRSADSRLPANAGKLVREALTNLLGPVELNSALRPPSLAVVRANRRRLDEAIQRASEMRRMLAVLIGKTPFDFVVLEIFSDANEVLDRLSDRLETIRAKAQRAVKKGRRRDAWSSSFLSHLAVWWHRQGWQPTTSHLGAYMTVACLVMGFRRGQDGPVPRIAHSAVTRAWQSARNILAMDETVAVITRLRAAGQLDESDYDVWRSGSRRAEREVTRKPDTEKLN